MVTAQHSGATCAISALAHSVRAPVPKRWHAYPRGTCWAIQGYAEKQSVIPRKQSKRCTTLVLEQ